MASTPRDRDPAAHPLRISVLSRMDPATPRTHSIAAVRLCAGLAAQGHRVELVAPAVTTPSPPARELFASYGVEHDIGLRYLPVGRGTERYETRVMVRLLAGHAHSALRRSPPDAVISDDVRFVLPYLAAARTRARGLVTAPWLHGFRGRRLERYVCSRSTCVLVTNRAISNDLADAGVSSSPTFVTGNPVPKERVEFGRHHAKADARNRLGLDSERRVIAYTGKLFLGMSELGYLLRAAARMPECLFVLTGGQPPVIERLNAQLGEAGATNVRLAGMLGNPEETRYYQKAADVLVTYYSTDDHPYAHQQLPAKLAEYMTTGNPVVAADFPAVRELLNRDNGILVSPHDDEALVRALRFAVEHEDEAAALAARAQRDVATRTSESVGEELGRFLSAAAEGARH